MTNGTLYLSIDNKNKNIKFNKIRLALTAVEKNSEIPVTEKIYQYGKIISNEIVSYKLKVDNYTGDIRIQFAANSRNIDFAINNSPNQKKNMNLDELEIKEERGKWFVTFNKPKTDYIYLNVFAKDDKIDSRLNNYVFKYMNSINRKNFFEYPILGNNGTITANYENSKLKVIFNKIDKSKVDVTYSLKISKKWDKSEDELNQTIAFTEYSPTVIQVYNPLEERINMEIDNIELDQFSYLTVIAQIKDGPIIEYVAYDPIYTIGDSDINDKSDMPEEETNEPEEESNKPEEESDKYEEEFYESSEEESDEQKNEDNPQDSKENKDKGNGDDEDDDDDDDDKALIIIVSSIGGVIFVILIVFIVVVLLYNRKTKNLLDQVNQISFAEADIKDKNANYLLDGNELK